MSNNLNGTTMTHQQAQTYFADLQRGTVNDSRKNDVERHLAGCTSCGQLYQLFNLALKADAIAPERRLKADPFLPTRIRAIAAERAHPHRSVKAALRWSFASVAFGLAVTLGILLGEGISHPRATIGDETIVSDIASTLSQYTVTDQWSSAVQSSSASGDSQ